MDHHQHRHQAHRSPENPSDLHARVPSFRAIPGEFSDGSHTLRRTQNVAQNLSQLADLDSTLHNGRSSVPSIHAQTESHGQAMTFRLDRRLSIQRAALDRSNDMTLPIEGRYALSRRNAELFLLESESEDEEDIYSATEGEADGDSDHGFTRHSHGHSRTAGGFERATVSTPTRTLQHSHRRLHSLQSPRSTTLELQSQTQPHVQTRQQHGQHQRQDSRSGPYLQQDSQRQQQQQHTQYQQSLTASSRGNGQRLRPTFLSQPVYQLACAACIRPLCVRAMKAVMLSDHSKELYSTDMPPAGLQLVNEDRQVRHCSCRIRDSACLGCGQIAGYHVTQPCPGCLNDQNNGHFWMFYSSAVYHYKRNCIDGSGDIMLWANVPSISFDQSLSQQLRPEVPLLVIQTNTTRPCSDGRPLTACIEMDEWLNSPSVEVVCR